MTVIVVPVRVRSSVLKKTIMKSYELENIFINFFKKKNYVEVPEMSLIPKNDATLLFTNSGMVQFKNIFLGREECLIDKAVTAQTCVRLGGKHNDLKNIGSSAHHNTSFRMLGNFGFNNVLKDKAINEAWDFLVNILELNKNKLYISVHENDSETFSIWRDLFKGDTSRIFLGSDKSNFWSMDKVGPCGYCTEIFYNIDDNNQNLLEIWNLVFIQFNKELNVLNKLKNIYLDTGLGLERVISIKQGCYNNFDTDIYKPLLECLFKSFNIKHNVNKSIKIIVDHLKTVCLLLKENIVPGNDKREYVLKKLIRRSLIEKERLHVKEPLFNVSDDFFYFIYNDENDVIFAREILKIEEEKFIKTLQFGHNFFKKMLKNNVLITNKDLFVLYDTHGIPIDLIKALAEKNSVNFNIDEFNKEMMKQIERSKLVNVHDDFDVMLLKDINCTIFKGYSTCRIESNVVKIIVDGKEVHEIFENQSGIIIFNSSCFYSEKGGQLGDVGKVKKMNNFFDVYDTQESNKIYLHYGKMRSGSLKIDDTVILCVNKRLRRQKSNNHSATHLLHAVLQDVLGSHVKQMGSLITSEYLRFDFAHFAILMPHEIKRIEYLVNKYIKQKLKVITTVDCDIKSGDSIRVVSIGNNVSRELCAGTHVKNTSKLFLFKIVKEYGVGSNIRRIEALTGDKVLDNFENNEKTLALMLDVIKCTKECGLERVKKILVKNKCLEKDNIFLALNLLTNYFTNEKNIIMCHSLKVINLFDYFNYVYLIPKIISNMENVIVFGYFIEHDSVKISINLSKRTNININVLDIIADLKTKLIINGGGTTHLANISVKNYKINDVSKLILSYLNDKLQT